MILCLINLVKINKKEDKCPLFYLFNFQNTLKIMIVYLEHPVHSLFCGQQLLEQWIK